MPARIVIEDVNADPDDYPHRAIAASIGYRGLQSTPLFDRTTGKPLGMLSTLFRDPYKPSEQELRLTDLYAGQAADVIAFRLAEQCSRDTAEQLRLALEAGQMSTWEWDAANGLVKADAFHQAMFGLPPQQGTVPTEVHWAHMLPDEVRAGTEQAKQALRNGTDLRLQQRIIRADGEMRWMLSRGCVKNGDPARMIGASYDITERVRAEQALLESQARLQAAVDLLKLGCYAWAPQTNELEWDDTMRALWGMPAGAPVNYDVWRAGIHPEDLGRVEDAMQRCADPSGDGMIWSTGHLEK